MKRICVGLFICLVLRVSGPAARAGGGNGCSGGSWSVGIGYGGYWGGNGFYFGGAWPGFSIGVGFSGGYPAASYPAPVYRYAYAPPPVVYARPTYVYRVVQPQAPKTSVSVAAAATARPVATASTRVYTKPASTQVVQKTYAQAPPKPKATPAPAPATTVATSKPATGKWVLDAHPYQYPPEGSGPSPQTATYVVVR